jgi:hypothetical protein
MKIRELTYVTATTVESFDEGKIRLRLTLPRGARFISFVGQRLFCSYDEKELAEEHCYLWRIPTGATLPPQYSLKYLGSAVESTTAVHYFAEADYFDDNLR